MATLQVDAHSLRIAALEQQFQGMNMAVATITNRQQDQDTAISTIHTMVRFPTMFSCYGVYYMRHVACVIVRR